MSSARASGTLLLAAVGLGSALFGAFATDPMGAVRAAQVARLRGAGAREERFRSLDGTWLRVLELGPLSAETPVVCLHGLGADAAYWTDTALALRRDGRTVLLPDAPGSGASERPSSPEGYGLAARVLAVDALVDALGLSRVDLVGHSLGGWTAAAYARRSPRHVRRLVLVDSAGFTPAPPAGADAARRVVTPTDRAGARILIDLLFARKPFPVAGFVLDAFGRSYRAGNVVQTVDQLSETDSLLGHEPELLRGTVFLWGEDDALFPLTDARRAAARVGGGRLLVVTGVGHDTPLEAPAAFREALRDALDIRLTAAPPARTS